MHGIKTVCDMNHVLGVAATNIYVITCGIVALKRLLCSQRRCVNQTGVLKLFTACSGHLARSACLSIRSLSILVALVHVVCGQHVYGLDV